MILYLLIFYILKFLEKNKNIEKCNFYGLIFVYFKLIFCFFVIIFCYIVYILLLRIVIVLYYCVL